MRHELRIMVFAFIALFMIHNSLFISPVYAVDPTPCAETAEFGKCPAGLQEFEDIVGNIISVVVGLGFIAMLMMIIMAGIKYLMSGGEPKAIQAAHQTLTWALFGLVFMAIAWLILQLIHAFTGINVTEFNIKSLCNVGGSWCQ